MAAESHDSPFPSTRWTVVLRLRDHTDDRASAQALSELCRAYWYPLYAFARRKGHSPEDAEDATQGFFAYLLELNLFASAEPQLGKLRTFLLTAYERYLGGERDRANAQKRGGGQRIVSLDLEDGEGRYLHEPVEAMNPQKLFERSWAVAVLETALRTLASAEETAGRRALFQQLEPFLSPSHSAEGDYTAAAARLGLREDAVRRIVSRLRHRFRAELRTLIADTLREPSDAQIDDELASLRAALRG